ncbi:hypothetical protein L7F22_025160 [Adiantum nelumboides]|nr:hypothetical protein [Adiantum nelumboides]
MLRGACKRAGGSRLLLHNGDRVRASTQQGGGQHLPWQSGQCGGFCTSPSPSKVPSEASLVGQVGDDLTVQRRWVAEGVGDGLSQAAVQSRSLRKANTQPMSDLERACIQMLWRRNVTEPIEVTLDRAQFPLTAPNLSLVLTHLRSSRDALRLYLCFLRANPSFVPEKALVDALGRFWRHERERFPVFMAILNDLRSPSCQITPRKLTSLLRGYGWAGLVDDVLRYLCTCKASYGFKPDFVHYSCALHTCVAEERLDAALQIFDQMKENGCPPTYDTFQSLIRGLLNMKQATEAGVLFEQMLASKLVKSSELPRRVVSYVNIINKLLQAEDIRDARSFLLRMNDMGFVPDYFTCAKALNAYHIRGLTQDQHDFYEVLKEKGILPDVDHIRRFVKEHKQGSLTLDAQTLLESLLTSLVSASTAENVEKNSESDSRTLVADMESSNQDTSGRELDKAEILIFDRVIYGLAVHEKSEDAFEILLRWVENSNRKIILTAITSAILFDSLCWDSAWEAAEHCLRLMMEWGHMPELKVYNAWVVGSVKAERLENVSKFLSQFSDRNLILDGISYNVLIEKFCMAGKMDVAMKLTRDANTVIGTPDVVSYSRMIQSFAKAGDFDAPRKLLAEMVEMGMTPYALPFTPLVQRLCLSGKVDEALAFVEEIEAKGCKPVPSLYTLLVSAYCKASKLQDAFNVMDIMKAKGVTPDPQTHKDLFGSCMGTRMLKPTVQAC